jgi:hypothetical protein
VDELMERQELSAAADCGWPDTFNSVGARLHGENIGFLFIDNQSDATLRKDRLHI